MIKDLLCDMVNVMPWLRPWVSSWATNTCVGVYVVSGFMLTWPLWCKMVQCQCVWWPVRCVFRVTIPVCSMHTHVRHAAVRISPHFVRGSFWREWQSQLDLWVGVYCRSLCREGLPVIALVDAWGEGMGDTDSSCFTLYTENEKSRL